jgi:alpha-galactosidase
MLNNFNLKFKYSLGGKEFEATELESGHFKAELAVADVAEHSQRLTLKITPFLPIKLITASLAYQFSYVPDARVLANGYQSWTTTREWQKHEKQRGLRSLSKIPFIKAQSGTPGDYFFRKYPNTAGKFHAYSYGYVRDGAYYTLFGSLSERWGFTIFNFDMNAGSVVVEKDIEGVTVDEKAEYTLFDFVCLKGTEKETFDKYFEIMGIKKPRHKHMSGYTSWYNYYGDISEEIMIRDLNGMSRLEDKANIFQIDDGYQTKVGDWLTLKDDLFPNGMAHIAKRIHEKGYLAGLWLAPFSAARDSKIAKDHPDWLVKDEKGKPRLGVSIMAWGGAYTLDFYNKEAAAYIKKCFDVILKDWGFDMLKLDFLYSICMYPMHNKSRGQIMVEAMEFLRSLVGDKLILGCGVPLHPSFGLVDFCRISCDVAKSFADPFYNRFLNEEVPSTLNVIKNTVFRRQLNGRAFVNDPDVFYLRHSKLDPVLDPLQNKHGWLKFNNRQKLLLATVNNMCANILFVSDNIGGYNDEQLAAVEKFFTKSQKQILSAEYISKHTIRIKYIEDEFEQTLTFSLKSGKYSKS